jgi:predicted ATP-grasp superfamily ATP-dependent carboligase
MADGLVWEEQPRALRRPVLVAGFEGWNDAADAASAAAQWVAQHGGPTSRIASVDPEEHFDFQARRPTVELADGVTRAVRWPENVFSTVQFEGRDLVVLRGIEPSYRWKSFCNAVLTVVRETGCEMVVTFGALLADVPHTRKVRITGTATDAELIRRLDLAQSRYEGPTGIVGVLHDACHAAGVPSVSLWAPVPHYIAAPPNPPATLGLLERVGSLLGLDFELSRLEDSVGSWRRRVDEVAGDDDDVRAYVRKLEERYDAEDAEGASWGDELPSGEELASELERFLREQRGDR